MKRTAILTFCLFVAVASGYAADEQAQRQEQKRKRIDATQLLSRFDKNKDDVLEADEIPQQLKDRMARLDTDGDGKLSKKELDAAGGRPANARKPAAKQTEAPSDSKPADSPPDGAAKNAAESVSDVLFLLLDCDKDGRLSKEELENAVRLMDRDKNKDGLLELDELQPADRKRGEVITPAAKGERHQDTLAVGDMAPDFTLPDLSGKKEVTLSSFRGQRPVVLILASYT